MRPRGGRNLLKQRRENTQTQQTPRERGKGLCLLEKIRNTKGSSLHRQPLLLSVCCHGVGKRIPIPRQNNNPSFEEQGSGTSAGMRGTKSQRLTGNSLNPKQILKKEPDSAFVGAALKEPIPIPLKARLPKPFP